MILKSLPRKSTSFHNLIYYMEKPDKPLGETFVWNLSSTQPKAIVSELEENAQFLSPRANGNVFYHDIIAVEIHPHHNIDTLQEALLDAAQFWIEKRAPNHLAYGRCHLENNTAHIHLLISSNPFMGDRKSIRRRDFNQIRKDCIAYIAKKYPQLALPLVYETKSPTKTRDPLEQVKNRIESVLSQPITHLTKPLAKRLEDAGFQLYLRGKSHGVIDMNNNARKHRLKKFGLLEQATEILNQEQAIKRSQLDLTAHAHRLKDHYSATLEEWNDFLNPWKQ